MQVTAQRVSELIDFPEIIRDRRAVTFISARFDHRVVRQADLVYGGRSRVLLVILLDRTTGDQVNFANFNLVELLLAFLLERGYAYVVL